MRYKVTGIPTLLVFKGGQVVEQIVGYKPKEFIAQALDRHVGGTRLDAASADKATV
jgi:thioredoxin